MTALDIERIYEALALGIDGAGEGKGELFLAKVSMLLAHEVDDVDRTIALIGEAAK